MANYWYWYWNRHLQAVVLPELKKLYEFQEQHVVPILELRGNQGSAQAEPSVHQVPVTFYSDSPAVIERLRKDTVIEQFELMQALAVYTNATCEALYLEASRFLLLLHRKEILSVGEEHSDSLPVLGDLSNVFAEQGVNLKQLEGFEAYDLLRVIAHYHGHVRGDSGEELRQRRPNWVNLSPTGWGMALIQPAEVKPLYENLCKFLVQVIEALHQSW